MVRKRNDKPFPGALLFASVLPQSFRLYLVLRSSFAYTWLQGAFLLISVHLEAFCLHLSTWRPFAYICHGGRRPAISDRESRLSLSVIPGLTRNLRLRRPAFINGRSRVKRGMTEVTG